MDRVPPPIPPRPPGYEITQRPNLPPRAFANAPPRAVTACIDTHVTFSTDWYWHLNAPEFYICSRCYVDHIHGTVFDGAFQSKRFSDGKPRMCRFSKTRMKDYLWKEAVSSRNLEPAVEWMRRRSSIPDCKGVDGVKGKDSAALGIKWYSPGTWVQVGDNTFLVCEACYEDEVLINQFSHYFTPFPNPQSADAVWACDMAMPFVQNEYEAKGKVGDWQGFVEEAKARMGVPPCPKAAHVQAYGRNWYVPKGASDLSFVLCQACFVDQVLHSGEEHRWEPSAQLNNDLARTHTVTCDRGAMFNVSVLFSAAHEKKDFSLFWSGLDKLRREKPCESEGIAGGTWYTLPSRPSNFGVCAACYAGILEPLQVARFFVPMSTSGGEEKLLCCLNLGHPRLSPFFLRVYEMYITLDPRALDVYASEYAAVPACPRDQDVKSRRWYGWGDCTICPECYLDFARNSPLAELMEFRDTFRDESTSMFYTQCNIVYKEPGSSLTLPSQFVRCTALGCVISTPSARPLPPRPLASNLCSHSQSNDAWSGSRPYPRSKC